MFYLINSQFRTADQLNIETYNTIKSNSGNIAIFNSLLFRPDKLAVEVGNLLSDKTGEKFSSTTWDDTYLLNIKSENCQFKFNFDNLQSNNPYNILGINSNDNVYTNNFLANRNINNNFPIFESNIISLSVKKNIFEGTYNIFPTNYTIDNLCSQIQDTLIVNTQKSWIVNGNVNNRVFIDCLTPNIKFLFFWTTNVMYNVSNALGFPTDVQSNIFTSNIISPYPPLINAFITETDYLYLNTEETVRTNLNKNYSIPPETLNSSTFINNLQNLLNNNTNGSTWIVTLSNTQIITINLTSNNNDTFQFVFSDQLMVRIANCLGFARSDTPPSKIITGINPINDIINLEIDDKLILNMFLANDTLNYKLYKIPLSRPMYNPVECINHISNELTNSTNKDWDITSNNSSTINNNSYLNINLNDVDTSFIFLWGNVYSNNLSNSLGFANVDMSSYTNSIVGNYKINFNTDLNSNDRLYGNIKSNVYYTLTDYNITTSNDINRLSDYLERISGILFNRTHHNYIFTLLPISQRVQISIINSDTSFRILFGNYQMKNIATMLGFENENMPVYETTIIGTKSADSSIILTELDILHLVEKITNPPNIIKQYQFPVTQPFFNSNNFIDNFQTILNNNTITGNIWSVTNNTNFITIQMINSNYAFQILWGDSTMNNIGLALGFNQISPNAFVTTTSSQFSINRNLTFNTNDIFRVNIRNTTIKRTQGGLQQFPITLQMSTFNEFIRILPVRLQSMTNKLFRVINNTVTQKITIITDSSNTFFKIRWSNVYMDNIARMLGFNRIDTPDYENSITSDIPYDDTLTLLTSNIFFIEIAEDTNIHFDQIIAPFNVMIQPNFFNPTYFFQSINNIIKLNLAIPFNIEYNRLTKKITISSTTKFLINFGNLYNLSNIMGFNFIISPSYEFSFTSDNEVDMTLNVLTNDIINLQFLKSITEYDINFYDFYSLVHTQMLELYLYTETRLIWTCQYNTLTKKISVFLKSSKFKFITTDPLMKDLCIIYGFDPNNLNSYDFTQNGINKLSFNTYIDNKLVNLQNPFVTDLPNVPVDTTRNRVVYSLLNNSNPTKLEIIHIEPIIYTPNVLTTYLQALLNSKIIGLGFEVNYNEQTRKITITNNPETNFTFRFLFGNSTFIDRYMGFNRSNINDFSNSITSEKEINLSSQFGQIIINPNSIIHFNKLKLCSINLPKLENITYSNNFLTIIEKNGDVESDPKTIYLTNGYYPDISILLSTKLNSSGLSGDYTVSLSLDNKMTISVTNNIKFKILWSKNKILSNMCGFNPIDTIDFSNTIISDFVVDFVYPKFIYIDFYGLKYQTQILNDNKHVFILNLNHLKQLDNNNFTTIINCPNNNLHQLIFTLYDEHYNIISPTTNWELLLDFIQ